MKKLCSIFLLLFAFCVPAFAQSISVSLTTAPCNNNGVIQVTSTGFSGTVTYNFYDRHTLLANNTTGTLTSYSGGPLLVSASGSVSGYAYTNYAGAPPFTFTTTTTTAVCPALGTASAAITGGASPYTVKWYQANTSTLVATGNPVSIAAGSYDVNITDANGCTYGSYASGDSIYVHYASPVNLSMASTVAACTNGTASVTATGGTTPYSYTWSNGAHTTSITALVGGYYQVTVSDASGCTAIGAAYVQQTPAITVNTTVTNATCLLNNGGAMAFGSGGTGPYTYLWSNMQTTQSATGLSGNTGYSVVATDANGCTGSTSVYIGTNTPITATYSATASSCTVANGSATVTASGGTTPYTIVWNTFPVQTGATATGLSPGTYGFTITDATGCRRTGLANVPSVSTLSATTGASSATCLASNGSANVIASGGTTPYAYLWSTSATTTSISGIPSGSYSVRVTDAAGCSVVKSAFVPHTSPIAVGMSVTPATCLFNSNGSIVATPGGGTPPYTYYWSGGSSTTGTLSSLRTGSYSVTVTDAAGCTGFSYAYLGYNAANTSCYCTITGTVYQDANSNCTKDPSEAPMNNVQMHCSGSGYAYTNAAGVYAFRVPTGSYTLSQTVQAYYPLTACQSNAVTVSVTAGSGCSTTVNFADSTIPITDMKTFVVSYSGPPVPGNSYYQTQIVSNDGTIAPTGLIAGYEHDGQLGSPVSVPFGWSASGGAHHYKTNSSFTSVPVGTSHSSYWQYSTPTNIPIQTSLMYFDSVAHSSPMSNWLNDYTPWNNVNTYYDAVAGSYDPNNKEVSPIGSGPQGYLKPGDSVLTYTIHFQNTGNYPAQKVVLRDTLSTALSIYSVHPVASNYAFSTRMSEVGREIEFTFDNINLPPSSSEPLNSIGYVVYTAKLQNGLAPGTQIRNNAAIYFDYNAPVVTNTTLNTTAQVIQGVPGVSVGQLPVSVYPNPASDKVSVAIEADGARKAAHIRLVSLVGQTMLEREVAPGPGRSVTEISTALLSPGLYFVQVSDGVRASTTKLSIVR